jgi:hypothetical protein
MTRTRAVPLVVVLSLLLSGLLMGSGPAATADPEVTSPTVQQAPKGLPGGGKKVFGRDRFLFAYYGFAHPSTTFVLGKTSPDQAFRKMRRQGARLLERGERLLPVYELVVTVADAEPGSDGDYAHDALHSKVQEYVDAAERNGALLLLDLQPGRASFLEVAKRWEWALVHPWVGLALDTEWRMDADQVPGRDIGDVTAKELNKIAAWLSDLVSAQRLPEKLVLFHQHRTGNVKGISKVRDHDGVAWVQHVDAAGSPASKVATYDAVARPRQFVTGFMVFLDADVPVMKPRAIRRVDDAIRFVSHQ